MCDIFVISDLHLGHANILTFTGIGGKLIRPEFSCVEEMDEFMINQWNSVVGPQDIVYCLGDVKVGKKHPGLDRLRGRKRLILGNHDNGKDQQLQQVFQKITMWRMFPEFDCLLTHVPVIVPSTAKYHFNVHGHIHEKPGPTPMHINVCVEVMNYTPAPLEQVVLRHRDRLEELGEMEGQQGEKDEHKMRGAEEYSV